MYDIPPQLEKDESEGNSEANEDKNESTKDAPSTSQAILLMVAKIWKLGLIKKVMYIKLVH